MIRMTTLLFSCSILTACTHNPSAQNSAYILDHELSRSFQHIEASLTTKRPALLFSNHQFADNCQSYFSLLSEYELEESIQNQLVKSDYLMCDALNILSSSHGILDQVESEEMGKALMTQLDLRTFPSSLKRAASESSYTLHSLQPDHTSAQGHVAEFESEDWALTLTVVAVAQINHNTTPDWVVWVSDESTSGNYRAYSTLIIYDPGKKGALQAKTFLTQ